MKGYRKFLIVVLSIILSFGFVADVSAASRTFATGSYILTIEPCWQPNNDNNVITLPGYCDTDRDRDGAFQVYGMVYDLLRLGLPVYWIIQPNKTTPHDVDFSVLKSGSDPAVTIYHSSALSSTGNLSQVDYRGGPFVVDINDITADIKTQAEQTMGIAASGNIYTRPKVHKANYDFTAEVDKTLRGTPPKVAVLGEGSTQVLLNYLKAAGLGNRVFDIFTTIDSPDI
ncbi:MAG: hypothetical protein KAJ34_08785, partial [Thermodesulfovibrionia bacterium]|nr:hypothetical protein [Thermodesulfovibrionia bacterium]